MVEQELRNTKQQLHKPKMELFLPSSGFYEDIEDDVRIGITHISLYMSLLQHWNLAGGRNLLSIERALIIKAAKINAVIPITSG
jgi:hypothetical protein